MERADPTRPAAAAVEIDDTPRGLPRMTFLAILAFVVVLFLVARGPVWLHPWDIDALDSAIFWSYLPIPVLVAGGLVLARRFTWRFLFLDSLAITLIKYAVTFTLAQVFWVAGGPPPPRAHVPPPAPRDDSAEAPPAPTPIDPARTAVVRGAVTGADGKAVAGAFVHVSGGLEAFVFARPEEPVRVENDGARVSPALVVARAGQTIQGRSLDGHLHTLAAAGDAGGATFNIPMMASGVWSTMVVREPAKVSRLRCTVHPQAEAPAHLVVLDHPFFATAGEGGAFSLAGVPAGPITLTAWHPELGEASAQVTVPAGGEVTVALRFER